MLFAKLVQERASHAGKIGNAKMRKVRAELLNSTAAFIASLHHHLITYTRSSSLPGLSGAAHKMRSLCGRRHQVTPALSSLTYRTYTVNKIFGFCTAYSVQRTAVASKFGL